MENLVKFSNENSDIRKAPVSVSIDYDRHIYDVKILNYFGKFREYYGKDNKKFYEALSYAGYIMARTNINQFYEVFSLIENSLEKEALLEGLHKAVTEYSRLLYSEEYIEGEYNGIPSIVPFYPFNKDVNSLDNEFLKINNGIYLTNSGNLSKIEHSKDSLSGQMNVFEKRNGIERTNRYSFIPLSNDVVELSSRWLFQCDFDKYYQLLDAFSENDEYYDLVVESGLKVTADLIKLERKCNR